VVKSSPKGGLFLKFSKKLPKIKNHPMGENSPSLVTLGGSSKYSVSGRYLVSENNDKFIFWKKSKSQCSKYDKPVQ
jgi:hypothetical protein